MRRCSHLLAEYTALVVSVLCPLGGEVGQLSRPSSFGGGCPVCSVSLASGPTVVFASYAVIIMMLHLTKARR